MKARLIKLDTYCHKAKVYDKNDMILYFVRMEDEWNHKYEPIEIPKLKEIKGFKMNPTPLKALALELLKFTQP